MRAKTTALVLALLTLSACVTNGGAQVQWENITGTNQVAKVNGIKSLMQPGFY